MGALAAHHLLGRTEDSNLILLAGPDYARMRQLIGSSGIPWKEVHEVGNDHDDVERLREQVARRRESLIIIASMHEVEGRLDRSAFERRLTHFAYGADRVIYAGLNGAALVWPVRAGTRMEVVSGNLRVHQSIDVVAAGETVVGLTVDRL
jgi:hypothetical protein